MGIFFTFKYLFVIIFLLLSSFRILAQNDNPAIATLLDVEGSVQVFKKSSKSRSGVHGMLLFEGNRLLTHNKSKTTIKYGSQFKTLGFKYLNSFQDSIAFDVNTKPAAIAGYVKLKYL